MSRNQNQNPIEDRGPTYVFKSTKTYEHSVGLSCCFRQWRASHSHCQYLHGYALQVRIVFESPILDTRNWVVDFGDLKKVKQWLQDTFDHKTLVATDDPKISIFRELEWLGLIQMVEVKHTGCEEFARMIYKRVEVWLDQNVVIPAIVRSVEVCEHGGNSAIYERKDYAPTRYHQGILHPEEAPSSLPTSSESSERRRDPAEAIPGVLYKDSESRIIDPKAINQKIDEEASHGKDKGRPGKGAQKKGSPEKEVDETLEMGGIDEYKLQR